MSNPISITYAQTCDVFFMHAMPPSGLGQRGSVRHSKIALQTPITLPLGANRVSWALIAVNHEPRYTAAAALSGRSRRIVRSEDYGRVTSTRSCPSRKSKTSPVIRKCGL